MVAEPDILFKTLADGTRRRILQVLLQTELAVSELVEVLGLPQSSVSRHLKGLRDAGLVDARHAGTSATYFPLRSQNGDPADLRDQLVQWTASQELPVGIQSRIREVLHARRSESDAYFARVAHRWDQMRLDCFGPAFHLEALTALLPKSWVVADVGAGTGYLLPVLARQFARVIAIDPVEEMLEAARRRMDMLAADNVEYRSGSAGAPPLDDDSVDLCIASLVLHHDPTPGDALHALYRATKPGGQVLILEQRTHKLAAFHDLMQDRWWGFEPVELESQLAAAGFADTTWHPLASAAPTNHTAPEAPALFVLTGVRPIESTDKEKPRS